jgi:hypothetical protein
VEPRLVPERIEEDPPMVEPQDRILFPEVLRRKSDAPARERRIEHREVCDRTVRDLAPPAPPLPPFVARVRALLHSNGPSRICPFVGSSPAESGHSCRPGFWPTGQISGSTRRAPNRKRAGHAAKAHYLAQPVRSNNSIQLPWLYSWEITRFGPNHPVDEDGSSIASFGSTRRAVSKLETLTLIPK